MGLLCSTTASVPLKKLSESDKLYTHTYTATYTDTDTYTDICSLLGYLCSKHLTVLLLFCQELYKFSPDKQLWVFLCKAHPVSWDLQSEVQRCSELI